MLRRLGDARTIALGLVLFGLGDSLLVFQFLPAVVIGIFIAGLGLPWVIVGFATAIQQRTPAALQGRVYSAADAAVGMPQTLSIALGAGLSAFVDYRILVAVVAVVVVGTGLYLYTRTAEHALPATRATAGEPAR